MTGPASDVTFGGSVPKLYDSHLVPPVFEPYAADLTQRLRARALFRVLEIAAGTGVVTRALARRFGHGAVEGRIQAHIVTVLR